MPKLKLSRTNIEKLKPDPSQDTLFWDTETRGFGLRGLCCTNRVTSGLPLSPDRLILQLR